MAINPYYEHFRSASNRISNESNDNFYYNRFKRVKGHGLPNNDVGYIYKRTLHQRGFGDFHDNFHEKFGLGWSDALVGLFQRVKPLLKKGLEFLGQKAIETTANIASDAIGGENLGESARRHLSNTKDEIFAKAPAAMTAIMNISNQGIDKATKQLQKVPSRKLNVGVKRAKPRLLASAKRRKATIGKGFLSVFPALKKII